MTVSSPIESRPGRARGWTTCLLLVTLLAACGTPAPEPVATDRPPPRDVTPGQRPPADPSAGAPSASQPTPAAPSASAPAPGPLLSGSSPAATPAAAAPEPPVSIALDAGLYRCELNRRVVVRRIAPDRQTMVINWAGKDATLKAVEARTGALRFENVAAGLVWIAIVGKSMLLDSKAGRTLANECKL